MKTNTKKLLIPLLIVLGVVLIGGSVGAYYLLGNSSNTTSSETTPTPNSTTDQSPQKPEDKEGQPNTDTTPSTPQPDQSGIRSVSMVASADISGDMVYIRGGINASDISSGTCFAELKGPNNSVIKKDTSLLTNSTTTDCKTVVVSKSELSKGTWTITLNYLNEDVKGTSSAISITIE